MYSITITNYAAKKMRTLALIALGSIKTLVAVEAWPDVGERGFQGLGRSRHPTPLTMAAA